MLPPASYRALAPAHRTLYHSSAVRVLGGCSEPCTSVSVVIIRREIHYRANTNTKCRLVQLRNPTYPPSDAPVPLTAVRHRSTWGRSWECHSTGIQHRPECSWVRSDSSDVASTPMDKDCPACQDNQRRPYALSPRELLWQKKLEHMRQWTEKDPYEALFGKRHDRMAGVWQGWRRLQARWPFIQMQKIEVDRLRRLRDDLWRAEPETVENRSDQQAARDSQNLKGQTSAGTSVSTSSMYNNVRENSTDWEFDPISMRRVPPSVPIKDHNHSASIDVTDIPVKTYNKASSSAETQQPFSTNNKAQNVNEPTTTGEGLSRQDYTSDIGSYLNSMRQRLKTNYSLEEANIQAESTNGNVGDSKHVLDTSPSRRISKEDFESSYRTMRASKPEETDMNNNERTLKAAAETKCALARNYNADLEPMTSLETDAELPTKQSLEKAWTDMHDAKQERTSDAVSNIAQSTTDMSEDRLHHVTESADEQPHFRRGAPADDSREGRKAYEQLNRRDRPYKHMTAGEFGNHKAALLQSWARKHQPEEQTAAQKLLNHEVETQKAAMSAYENRKVHTNPVGNSKSVQDFHEEAFTRASRTSFTLQRLERQKEQEQDRSLVRELTSIYENHYGTIDENHKQGKSLLDNCLSDYESRLGNGGYNFRSGQDNFEEEAKTMSANPTPMGEMPSPMADTDTALSPTARKMSALQAAPATSAAPAASLSQRAPWAPRAPTMEATGYEDYDRNFGIKSYTFKSGQDDLEHELKTKTANPYAEAVAKAAGLATPVAPNPASQATGYEEHDRKLGPNPYIFVSGQDDLERELKTKSANPYAEAVARSTETAAQAPLLTKLETKYNLESEVEATKPEVEMPIIAKDQSLPVPASEVESSAPLSSSPVPEPSSDPQLYQILAYDGADQSVHTAAASSSFSPPTGETVLLLSDALTRLHAPAKFLPHLAKLQAEGYEIVSANRNLLVLKRMRLVDSSISNIKTDQLTPVTREELEEVLSETPVSTKSHPVPKSTAINPIDGTSRYKYEYSPLPTTGNFASPTGFVNHDIYPPLDEQEAYTCPTSKSPKAANRKHKRVRKEEAVFTGAQRRWNDAESSASKSNTSIDDGDSGGEEPKKDGRTRTILATAVTVLAGCYMAGFLVEELRSWPTGDTSAPEDQRSHGTGSRGLGLTPGAMKVKEVRGAVVQPGVIGMKDDEDMINAAQWVGAALCVTSFVGLVLGILTNQ